VNKSHLNYLFFVTKSYSFSILEPLQETIKSLDCGTVKWFTASSAKNYSCPGNLLKSNEDVLNYRPDVVLVPGNVVPHFWPGLKVQVFHGIDEEVKGFYSVTGFFDLYCTTSPLMTKKFTLIAENKNNFLVRETGWPKLDPVFQNKWKFPSQKKEMIEVFGLDPNLPIILYAPTFPTKYTSAQILYNSINELKDQYNWVIKFHPLMNSEVVNRYKQLKYKQLVVVDELNVLPIMAGSDLMLTDTSSVAYEFLPFDRPLITYQALARKEKGINIMTPQELAPAIKESIVNPREFRENRKKCFKEVHPYTDGQSGKRMIKAIEDIVFNKLLSGLKRKNQNFVRKYKIRKMITES